MLLAILSLSCGPPTGEEPPPVSWEDCEEPALVLTQSWDETTLPQRTSPEKAWPGLAIGDFNGDGHSDVLMAYGGGSALYLGDGSGQLEEDVGVTLDGASLPRARAAAAADLDSDGDLDAVLTPYEEGEPQLLLFNDGAGRFVGELLADSAYISWGTSIGDLDGDGRLDLYLATYNGLHEAAAIMAGEVRGSGHGVYFQQADGAFVRDDTALPASIEPGLSLMGALLDVEGDGDLDVYMTNDFGPFVLPNKLLLNDGTGHFAVDDDCDCDPAMYAMGTAVGDLDEDGQPDLYVSNVGSPKLLMNLGDGSFYDATLASGAYVEPTPDNMTSWGTVTLDADQDSCQDLLIVYGGLGSDGHLVMDYESDGEWTENKGQHDVLLLSDCQGGFTRAPADVFQDASRARAVGVGDLNGDGRPDVIVAGKHFLHTWLSEGGCPPGVTVRLDAGTGNRQGIGARVDVALGDRTLTQWMLPASTASSSEHALFFGLGGRSQADHLTVTWPDGSSETLDDVAAGTALALIR